MNLNKVEIAYFIGIGGIGMSALARYFNKKQVSVMGYDKTRTALTTSLAFEGISIHFEDSIAEIPQVIQMASPQDESILVVYTPAIPNDHLELNWFRNRGFNVFKRSEILGEITKQTTTIAVAGTHGKTSTSAMIAHILTSSGHGCNAFLGGITANYSSNLILSESSNTTVVEADEFDRSFLALYPDYAVITSMDADHLDIYGDKHSIETSFADFANQVSAEGLIIRNNKTPEVKHRSKEITYGIDGKPEILGANIRVEQGRYIFDYHHNQEELLNIELGMAGRHNVENAVSAVAIALALGIEKNAICKALKSFRGVRRRFEYRYKKNRMVYIDDYAHHPTEIKALHTSIREMYPGKKVTIIFQPHLYSRTRDFADEFAASLSLFDEILLLDIYPAREKPLPGIDSQMLLDKIMKTPKKVVEKCDLLDQLDHSTLEVLLTVGAGDIDHEIPNIEAWLSARFGENEL